MCHSNKIEQKESNKMKTSNLSKRQATGSESRSATPRSSTYARFTPFCSCLALIALVMIVDTCAGTYDFPIHQNLPINSRFRLQQQNQHQDAFEHEPSIQANQDQGKNFFDPTTRRSDESGAQAMSNGNNGEDEAQQIRQLHHVVDTVARMINEEEQLQGPNQQGNQMPQQQSPLASALQAPELMSEAAIQQAIEELERVQQHERAQAVAMSPAESQPKPTITSLDSQSSAKQSSIESLIDEIGDELIDDQLAAASQEAERLIRNTDVPSQGNAVKSDATTEKQLMSVGQEEKLQFKPADSYVSTSAPIDSRQQAIFNKTAPANSRPSSVLVGQLDPNDSELGSALTNDFYSFHAEPMGGEKASSAIQIEPGTASIASAQDYQSQRQQTNTDRNSAPAQPQNDLESAAQTRDSITQREPQLQSNPFNREAAGSTLRFDFSQPAPPVEAQQRRPPPNQLNQQDALVRAFRQQTGAASDDPNQFPASTLVPVASPDNFWRPTSAQQNNGQDTSDISSQYNRALSNQPSLPSLPASRFQNIGPSAPRSGQHIHFTGHSFVSSDDNQFNGPQQNGRDRPFSSTTPPLISVLSGVDTSGSNSVSWNPPAIVNPPAQSQQPQFPGNPFLTSTQPPTPASSTSGVGPAGNQFFPSPNQGPPSPLFRGAFQNGPERDTSTPVTPGFRSVQSNPSNFVSSTESTSLPETTTVSRLPPSSTQWSPSASAQPERDASGSQPRSSVRSLPNGQRFFSPNDLIEPTSTISSVNADGRRGPFRGNLPVETTTLGSTTTSTTPNSSSANSTAKKDDMVIYYYYYYDDNKNATVVAKNISSGATANPIPLDAAIEADGGVEDTPYMDDPAPMNTLRSSSPKPPFTSTTTSTTAATPSLSPFNNFEGSVREEGRGRGHSGSSRFSSTSDSPQAPNFDRNPNPDQLQNDQPRANSNFNTRAQASRSRPEQVSPFTSSPVHVPSTSSHRPFGHSANFDSNDRGNRFISTESPSTRVSSSPFPLPARAESPSAIQHSAPTAPNGRLQNQLIHSVLSGVTGTIPRQPSSPSTVSSQVTSNANHNSNRTPLSNASRYGTNNNLMLDPYGLDPAAPSTLAHANHPTSSDSASHQHQKNWSHGAPSSGSHQSQRKPVTASNDLPAQPSLGDDMVRGQNSNNARSQSFSPQRNQNPGSTPQNPRATQTAPAQPPSANVSPQPAGSRLTGTQQSLPASRQFFPESSNAQPADQSLRGSPQSPRQQSTIQAAPTPSRSQPPRQQTQTSTGELSRNTTPSTFEEPLNEVRSSTSREQGSSNGRPTTQEGNTGNGFTRSPLQVVSTEAPPSQQPALQRSQMSTSTRLTPSSQTSVSTSVTRSFVTPQQVQVTTTVNPPTITSTSVTSTVSQSSSQPVSTSTTVVTEASSSMPPQSVTSQAPSAPSSSNTPAQDSSPTTEGPETNLATTRKRFGNRTNRFQTRLNAAVSRSTTTSTSTTPAPSTSTSRRPLSSTTRKSSRQLFAGRRRLGSTQSDNSPASTVAPQMSESNVQANSSATDSSSSSQSSGTGRTRFGNNFTARARSSTSAPSSPEQASSNPKPSLFGAQRATFKPRTPFLRGNKPGSTPTTSAESSSPATSASANAMPIETASPSMSNQTDKESTDKPVSPNTSENPDEVEDSSTNGTIEDGETSSDRSLAPVTATNNASAMMDNQTTTVAAMSTTSTPAPEPVSGRNKPKVRPLFASRQRNTSLFGNRRSNSTATA